MFALIVSIENNYILDNLFDNFDQKFGSQTFEICQLWKKSY